MSLLDINVRRERERLGLSQAKLAELAQVPQHLLSAYELGKVELPTPTLTALVLALTDERRVSELATRPKRYRQHRFERVHHSQERVARAARTKGNVEYLGVLNEISRQHERTKVNPRALSLFSGCGGFSLGFSAGGFTVIGFLEADRGLRRIYNCNFPKSRELGGDVTKVSQSSLDTLLADFGRIDVIIGGPHAKALASPEKER